MKSRGKLGGQNKVPRLSNNREYVDALLSMNANQTQYEEVFGFAMLVFVGGRIANCGFTACHARF